MTNVDPLLVIARQRGLSIPEGMEAGAGRLFLVQAVAAELGMDWVELGTRKIVPDVLAALPRDFISAHQMLPFARDGRGLRVAVSDPIATELIDRLPGLAGSAVRLALAAGDDLRQAIDRELGDDAPPPERRSAGVVEEAAANAPSSDERDAPVIRVVQEILRDAVHRRASDIHLEPLAGRFRIRYRVDGELQEAPAPDRPLHAPITSRLKLMANLSIAEKRVPQDGRIRFNHEGRTFDLRVSSLPTVHGESLVMRVLDQAHLKRSMLELGWLPEDQSGFERQLSAADGLLLVTGPTGSGKTTTLYAALQHLNRPDRKIITVEDPVEYQLAGINQVSVNTQTGMTFASALRAMLRQAPNIIMVGEIRDRETAEVAINAALTGHQVFSTLHTNDAPSAVTRLLDLGVKPFLVAAALRSVLAQRLVRKICPACRQSHRPADHELRALGLARHQLDGAEIFRGTGCPACRGSGYCGRVGLFEIFLVHDRIRTMIYERVTAASLRRQARHDGMRTMREDGIRKVLAGLTTIEEVVSVTAGDHA